MKKLLTLALAVLGFTAAQAITFNWTATLTNGSGDAEKPGWCGIIVAEGLLDRTTFGDFKSYLSDSPHLTGSYSYTDTMPFAEVDKVVMNGETATYAELKGSTTGYNFTSSVDVTGLDSITFFYFNESWGFGQVIQVDGLGDIDEDITYNLGTWSYSKSYNSQTDTSLAYTVPEPTVLALLALGVAGVALKRKKVVA
ncbi:MAG: PEP-CTERM sorting domain-containing protein [bacterium]|nr:PEP-CTERM sorting domain-containing protein [bacterium]